MAQARGSMENKLNKWQFTHMMWLSTPPILITLCLSRERRLRPQDRPGPRLITLVGAPFEGVVVNAETPSDGGHHLMTGLSAPPVCIQELIKTYPRFDIDVFSGLLVAGKCNNIIVSVKSSLNESKAGMGWFSVFRILEPLDAFETSDVSKFEKSHIIFIWH